MHTLGHYVELPTIHPQNKVVASGVEQTLTCIQLKVVNFISLPEVQDWR
jgi:hypothetical protein